MSYTSYFYLLFFLGVLVFLYYLMPLKRRWLVLLGGSYFFYWLASGKLIVFLLMTTVSVYLGALAMEREQKAFDSVRKSLEKEERKAKKVAMMRRKRHIVLAMVLINVGLLAFLKYYHFFSSNVNTLGNSLNLGVQLPALKLVMPLGISFYTLSAVGYVIDVYRGQTAADHHLGRLALFLSLFTNITEGPISRYSQLAGQAFEGHRADYRQFTFGAQLILWGLFQKMVLADRAALLVSTVFGSPSDYSGSVVILAMFVYTLQIYADFAGCMDIVRGSAALFGIEIVRNFDQPFFSKSIGEFWRRWHMTLGAWFKDYIFYPVTLSKTNMRLGRWAKKHLSAHLGQVMPTAFALFFVWLANGIWHGAAWEYVAYGMYYYVLTLFGLFFKPVIFNFYEKTGIQKDSCPWQFFLMARTFILVNIGMLLFRANSLRIFADMFVSMFRKTTGQWLELGLDIHDMIVLAAGVVLMLLVGIARERGICIREQIASWQIVFRWIAYAGAFCAIVLLGAYGSGYGVVDPLYANF